MTGMEYQIAEVLLSNMLAPVRVLSNISINIKIALELDVWLLEAARMECESRVSMKLDKVMDKLGFYGHGCTREDFLVAAERARTYFGILGLDLTHCSMPIIDAITCHVDAVVRNYGTSIRAHGDKKGKA